MRYADMTDEEYDALDEELTRNIPKLGPNGSDWFAQREMRLLGLSAMTIDYLLTKAASDKKSPAQIIEEIVQEKVIAATV
ncbi:MAG: hypothetical protein FWG66_09805 [Spirochaetes bacterium]|nr:hypothetical protein [Spirochaetota bacterium]